MPPERWSDPEAVQRAAAVLGDGARTDAPLGALTTSRVGGPAAVAFVANGPDDLQRVQEARSASGLEILVVGRGSNLLIADRGFEGIALHLGDAYARIELDRGAIPSGCSQKSTGYQAARAVLHPRAMLHHHAPQMPPSVVVTLPNAWHSS